MRIISFIEDEQLVKKILEHLGLWDVDRKPAPRANAPPNESFDIYDEFSSPSADDYIIDANYPMEAYLKKSCYGQSGELCSNRIELSMPLLRINLDNKTCDGC